MSDQTITNIAGIVVNDSAAQAMVGHLAGDSNVLFCSDNLDGLNETLIAELSYALENSGQAVPARLDHEDGSAYASRLAGMLGTGINWLIG